MTAKPSDTRFPIKVGMTKSQLVEISKQADLGPFDGRARSEWIVGVMLDEPRDELLERVLTIRDAERARFRAEIKAAREARERAAVKRATHGGSDRDTRDSKICASSGRRSKQPS
jgi:hypothetical protein